MPPGRTCSAWRQPPVWSSPEMPTSATALAWLRLLRLPNHATVVADVLAGFLIASGVRGMPGWPPPACWWAIGAALALYAAGMVLNDAYDLGIDRVERPERPLPRGLIAPATAFAVGGLLLAIGTVAAVGAAWTAASPWPALVGGLLMLAVWAYDAHLKPTALGPFVMGSCRGLAWLLGMTAAGGPHGSQWLIPAGMGTYVAGITLFARDEAAAAARAATLRFGAALMVAGLALAAGPVWQQAGAGQRLPGTPLPAVTWLLLWGIISTSVLVRALPALVSPQPARIQAAVGNAILSIITLDAILVLASCGERWSIAVLALLAVAVVGRQVAPTT